MLAVSFTGAGAISNRLASDASVSHHRHNDEWTFCFPFGVDYAARENFGWIKSKLKL